MNSDWFKSVPNVVTSEPGFLFTTDTWVAIGSAVIALSALGLAIHEGYQTRKHKRYSVRPKIHFDIYYSYPEITYSLINGGLGPARVTSVNFYQELSEKLVTVEEIEAQVMPLGGRIKFQREIFPKYGGGLPLLPGESVSILILEIPENFPKDVFEALTSIILRTSYSDMYNQQFKSR